MAELELSSFQDGSQDAPTNFAYVRIVLMDVHQHFEGQINEESLSAIQLLLIEILIEEQGLLR